jgi:hypothetical protein
VDFFILGSFTLPSITKQAAAEAVSAGSPAVAVEPGVISDHGWKHNAFPWVFWFVRRSDKAEECNCKLTAVTVRSVATFPWDGQLGDPFVDSLDICLPLMVNFKPLGKGEELVVFWKSNGQKLKPSQSIVRSARCVDGLEFPSCTRGRGGRGLDLGQDPRGGCPRGR